MENVNPDYKFDFFISYAHLNARSVKRLVRRLKEDGYRVWIDDEQIGAVTPMRATIINGMKESAFIVLALSPEYFKSGWADYENYAGHSIVTTSRSNRLIPVLIEEVEIPPDFRHLYVPNFAGGDWELQYQKMILNVRQPSEEPAPEKETPLNERIEEFAEKLKSKFPNSSRTIVETLAIIRENVESGKSLQADNLSQCAIVCSDKAEEMLRKVIAYEKIPFPDSATGIGGMADILVKERPGLLEGGIKQGLIDIDTIRNRVAHFKEKIIPEENLPYLFNSFAENFVSVVDWFYGKYGKIWEDSYAERAARITTELITGKEEPRKAISSPNPVLHNAYKNALDLFGKEKNLSEALNHCKAIIDLAPALKKEVVPLIVGINFRILMAQLRQCSPVDDLDQCLNLQARIKTLFSDNKPIQVCSKPEQKDFEAICRQINLSVELRRGIEQLAEAKLEEAQETFKFVLEMADPANASLKYFGEKAKVLKEVTQHFMNLHGHEKIVAQVETAQRLDWPFAMDWEDLDLRLNNIHNAHERLRELLSTCQDLFKRYPQLAALLSRIDNNRIAEATRICRINTRLQMAYRLFLEKVYNDNLAAAVEVIQPLIGQLKIAKPWFDYLNAVEPLQQGLQRIVERSKPERENELDESYWHGLADEVEKLSVQCLPLTPFHEEHLKPMHDKGEVGQSIFVDFERIFSLYKHIRECRQLAGLRTRVIKLVEDGEFEPALQFLLQASKIDAHFGDLLKLRADVEQALKLRDELSKIEAQISLAFKQNLLASKQNLVDRLKDINPNSESRAYKWLMGRKEQILETIFVDENAKRKQWIKILEDLQKSPYVKGDMLGQSAVKPEGFHRLLCFQLKDQAFLKGIVNRLQKKDKHELLGLQIEDLIDRHHHHAPALLIALGLFDKARTVVNDQMLDGVEFIELYNKGVLHYLEYLKVSAAQRNDCTALRRAHANLLPLFLTRRGRQVLSSFEDSLEIDKTAPDVVRHLESLLSATNDAAAMAEFHRDKLIIQTIERLSDLCRADAAHGNREFGFVTVEGKPLPCGRVLVEEMGLYRQVGEEIRRLELCAAKQPQAETLLWQLRLLLSSGGAEAFMLFSENRYSEALNKIPNWLENVSAANPQWPAAPEFEHFCAHIQCGPRQLILDFRRLQAYIHQILGLQTLGIADGPNAISGQSIPSYDAIARYLEPCLKEAREVGIETEMIEPIAKRLHEIAKSIAEKDLKPKYKIAMTLIDFTNFMRKNDSPVITPARVDFVIRYGLGVSSQIFKITVGAAKGNLTRDHIEKLRSNVQMHDRLLRGLRMVAPYDAGILYYLGELACMDIMLLGPNDDIATAVHKVFFSLDELQKQAKELRDTRVHLQINELKMLIDQIRTHRNLNLLQRRLSQRGN